MKSEGIRETNMAVNKRECHTNSYKIPLKMVKKITQL